MTDRPARMGRRVANNESSEIIDCLKPFILTLRPGLIMSKTSDDSLLAGGIHYFTDRTYFTTLDAHSTAATPRSASLQFTQRASALIINCQSQITEAMTNRKLTKTPI